MMLAAATIVVLLVLGVVVRTVVVRALALAHQQRTHELELAEKALGIEGEADLPAYVDPEDAASMEAWRQTKTELDRAW